MNVLRWSELSEEDRAGVLRRATAAAGPEVSAGVATILAQVRDGGDDVLILNGRDILAIVK